MGKRIIAVIGDSECREEVKRLAYEVGRLVAKSGAYLICGGYGGVMAESARGARDAGGTTIGVLSGVDRAEANPAIDIPIVTGMRDARNIIIARTAHGVIAVSGGFGTLTEIGFSLICRVPLVGLRTWKLDHHDPAKRLPFPSADTPEEAFKLLLTLIRKE